MRCGQLILSAERHYDGGSSDRRVKSFGETALRAYVEVAHEGKNGIFDVAVIVFAGFAVENIGGVVCRNAYGGVLGCAVRREKFAAQADYGLAHPVHLEARFFRDDRDDRCLKIFAFGIFYKFGSVVRIYDNSHSFLRLGDRKLGAVETFVFLGNAVKIYRDAVGKLSDRDGNSACAEVVASLDETCNLAATEQSLYLSFFRRIAFLHFSAALCQRACCMCFRGAGRAAAAVSAGLSSEEYYKIARLRCAANNVFFRRCSDDRADFKALGNIARMIYFIYAARCETDLISVR